MYIKLPKHFDTSNAIPSKHKTGNR